MSQPGAQESLHEGSLLLSPLKDDASDGLPVRSTVFLPKYNRYNSDPVAWPVMWISKWIQGETPESLRYLLRVKSTLGPELRKPESQVQYPWYPRECWGGEPGTRKPGELAEFIGTSRRSHCGNSRLGGCWSWVGGCGVSWLLSSEGRVACQSRQDTRI